MTAAVYGTGDLYGGTGIAYGRIGAALDVAQSQMSRETGLIVKVIDERLDQWELVAGTRLYSNGIGRGLYMPLNGSFLVTDIEYWSYRGNTAMLALPNGNIIRARIGDPTNGADRQLWVQTVTDPTITSQWTSWSVLYSGTHYGTVTLQSNGAGGYNVFHTKAGKLYKNNVLKWDVPAAWPTRSAIGWVPVEDPTDTFLGAGWVQTIARDEVDNNRRMDYFWTDDIDGGVFEYDPFNYAWYRPNLCGIYEPDQNRIHRYEFAAFESNARDGDHGIAMAHAYHDATVTSPVLGHLTEPRTLRGIGGGSGINYVSGAKVAKFSDGFYYLFALEVHEDASLNGITNLGYGLPVWMRSKDLVHWTEPVVGPAVTNSWGSSNAVERQGYLYWADMEVVYRRPFGPVEYDVSNYVPEGSFELPRDNQPASGQLKVANPDGVNDILKNFSDREIIVQPGLKTANGTYEYQTFDRFFVKQCQAELDGKISRLNLTFGNIWDRLDTDLRDTTNFVGRMIWDDWAKGKRNKKFNYYFLTDTAPVEGADFRLKATGICLYTGWKGHNPDITVHFSGYTGNPRIILRYQDKNNYLYLEYDGSTLAYRWLQDGVMTELDSWGGLSDSTPTIRIAMRFDYYQVWFNGTSLGTSLITDAYLRKVGYVGFSASTGPYYVSQFHLEDYEANLTSEDLIRSALAFGDFHDAIIGGATSRIFGLIWGPQTDVPTAAAGLKTSLETDKLQLIWRNGVVSIGKFNDQTPVRTIQNEIISANQVDEANRRINMAVVDGNDQSWIQVDTDDVEERGRQVTRYADVPELLDHDAVVARAVEEIRQSSKGVSPGGDTPLFFDVWRMDAVNWVDPTGATKLVRIEGIKVDLSQGLQPHQRETFDTSEYSTGSSDGLQDSGIVTS